METTSGLFEGAKETFVCAVVAEETVAKTKKVATVWTTSHWSHEKHCSWA
jgi:hypothetical protein